MAVTIQVKRNANTDAAALAVGELGFHDVAVGGLWIGSTTGNQQIATKVYVDSVAQGLNPIADVVAMTTGALAACTYGAGTLGVGATLTEDAANGALAAQDGVTLTLNQRLLVKDQAAPAQNGVYQLSVVGDGATKWVLTRVTDMDVADEIASVFVFVSGGTTGADTGWVCTTEPEAVVVGTSAVTFAQFSAAGQITAGTGLSKSGNTIGVGTILGRLVTVGESTADNQILVGTASAGVLAWESGATALTSLGAQAALTMGIADTNNPIMDETAEDNDYAKFTATGFEGRTYAEVKTDLGLSNVTNIKNKLDATVAPAVTDDDDPGGYSVGSMWFDVTADKAYVCLDNTGGAAVWKELSSAATGATPALDNLASVAINAALIPGTAGALDIGSTTKPWSALWLSGASGTPGTNQFKITGTAAGGLKTITMPDLTGTMLLDTSTIDGGTWAA
jgi:hypothetical protein